MRPNGAAIRRRFLVSDILIFAIGLILGIVLCKLGVGGL